MFFWASQAKNDGTVVVVVVGCCCCRLLLLSVVVGCRLSVVGCRLSVVGCRLSVVCCLLSVVCCLLSVVVVVVVVVVAPAAFSQSRSGRKSSNWLCFRVFLRLSEQKKHRKYGCCLRLGSPKPRLQCFLLLVAKSTVFTVFVGQHRAKLWYLRSFRHVASKSHKPM